MILDYNGTLMAYLSVLKTHLGDQLAHIDARPGDHAKVYLHVIEANKINGLSHR